MSRFESPLNLVRTAVLALFASGYAAFAQGFTAGDVAENMPPRERIQFITGIVEGLATARERAGDAAGAL